MSLAKPRGKPAGGNAQRAAGHVSEPEIMFSLFCQSEPPRARAPHGDLTGKRTHSRTHAHTPAVLAAILEATAKIRLGLI